MGLLTVIAPIEGDSTQTKARFYKREMDQLIFCHTTMDQTQPNFGQLDY